MVSFGSTLSPSAMGAERRDMFIRIFKVINLTMMKMMIMMTMIGREMTVLIRAEYEWPKV